MAQKHPSKKPSEKKNPDELHHHRFQDEWVAKARWSKLIKSNDWDQIRQEMIAARDVVLKPLPSGSDMAALGRAIEAKNVPTRSFAEALIDAISSRTRPKNRHKTLREYNNLLEVTPWLMRVINAAAEHSPLMMSYTLRETEKFETFVRIFQNSPIPGLDEIDTPRIADTLRELAERNSPIVSNRVTAQMTASILIDATLGVFSCVGAAAYARGSWFSHNLLMAGYYVGKFERGISLLSSVAEISQADSKQFWLFSNFCG